MRAAITARSVPIGSLAEEDKGQLPLPAARSEDDTRLSVLMLRVSHSFLREKGI
jgi:hypothetical protein